MASFTIASLVTTPQVLRDGETGRITAVGTLSTVGTAAISGSGRFTVAVEGEVSATNADAIRATSATSVTITVGAAGLIRATGGEAIDIAASETVKITNSGTITGDILIAPSGDGRVSLQSSGLIDGDIIVTGNSRDVIDLRGGQVTGTVSGGGGSDDYYVDRTDIRIVESADPESLDEIYTSVSYVLPANSNIEALHLLGTTNISATATGTARVSLYGNSGNNTLTGAAGADFLQSNGGVDRMIGGTGNDLYVTEGDDVIVEQPGGGTDTIRLRDGNPNLTSYTVPSNIEVLENGSSIKTLNGNSQDNVLVSYGSADETFNGGGGSDYMSGGAGDDTYITDGGDHMNEDWGESGEGIDTVLSSVSLTLSRYESLENLTLTGRANTSGGGNGGDNTIIGNSGNNTLYGHGGTDTMTGGAGRDSFVFSASMRHDNIDRITDFNTADDTIRLSDKVFAALTEGALPASAFARNTSGQATDASDRIIYETDTGRLFYDSDGTGSAPRGHFATLAPGLSLTAADFFVF